MNSKHFISHLIASLLLFGFTGCGPKGPPVQLVEGTISVNGNLLESCTLVFIPKDDSGDPKNLSRPLMASATTDEQGFYRLSAIQGGAIGGGTTVGEYTVSIVKKDNTSPPLVVQRGGSTPTSEQMRPRWRYHTPELFENNSPITVEVKKGKNRFDFDLQPDGTNYTVNGESFTVAR